MPIGLSNTEATERLKNQGYNELPSAKPKNIWRIAFDVMREPMFLLLISCGLLYMLLGDYKEGVILISSIIIIIFITFYQYQKTERSLEALRNLSSPRALVLRDGKELRIPGREVVIDDVILLHEGDRIPADASLIETMNLTVDESLLTGESHPVSKTIQKDALDQQGLLFSGTLVVQGKGIAKVLSTGIKTQFGKIGTSLQSIEQEETRLQKEMKVLIKNLFIGGAIISVAVVVAFYFSRGNFIQSLLNGLAASMAILPEEFPVVLTVFLALGAWRLSGKNVLTRNPSAIETLGSATVLCSDKTGTITQNKMEVSALYLPDQFYYKKNFSENKSLLGDLVSTAFYASQKDSIDPMEKAIGEVYHSFTEKNFPDGQLVREYPLSKDLFAMTRVLQTSENVLTAYCKGAPESIIKLCKLNEQASSLQLRKIQEMAAMGYRVLGLATTVWNNNPLPDSQSDFDFSFLGLIGFEDPIRPEVPQSIKECREAGIKVIMITGDYPATAKSIATQIGMPAEGEILTGPEIKLMSETDLKEKIKKVNVFARIVPEQKLQIIKALKANGEIVAMTGDGVNDAPALKAADIGVAMGKKGTDVAREASSLVLLDDNFASIVSAIRLGRKIFDNLQKAMSYILAIHIPIIGLTLLPAFFTSLPLLLMPLHIVFMELIIDPVCSIAFESEQEEAGIMKRAPRNPTAQFFGFGKIMFSITEGLLLLAMVIIVYFVSLREGHTEGEVRAIAFSSLIVGNVFLILTSLSKTRSFISVIMEKNTAVLTIIFAAFVMLLLTISVSFLQDIFNFEFPGFNHFIPSLIGAFSVLVILETIKYLRLKENFRL